MLRLSTENTVVLLKNELKIQLKELENQWHYATLERIFIENRIYRDIEEESTWSGVLQAINSGLVPYVSKLKRQLVEEDIVRLTEIKIKRISKFDIDKAQEKIEALEGDIAEVKNNLEHLIEYAIRYFNHLIKTYGGDKERKSEIRIFDDVDAKKVVVRNQKLFINKEEGFVGTSLKKDEYLCDCSDIDDIIVFTKEGKMQVVRVDSKVFVGKNIIHASIFKRNDSRTIYNMIYRDGKRGTSFIKRFAVKGITRDKIYNMTQGTDGSEVLYFSANSNGEAEVVTITLRNSGSIKKLKWDLDFADLQIKGRGVRGNTVTKYSILRVDFKEKGVSTLKPRNIWFDQTINRLNTDERGVLLGAFSGENKLLLVNNDGNSRVVTPDISLHFDDKMIRIEKWIPKKPLTAIYFDREKERYFIKRFLIESETKEDSFVKDGGELLFFNSDWRPVIEVEFFKPRDKEIIPPLEINVEEFIAIKGFKALGNQITSKKVKKISLKKVLPYKEEVQLVEDIEVTDQEEIRDDVPQTKLDF